MDVLPAVGGSWLRLDGSMSARVQLAVGGSCLKPSGSTGVWTLCFPGCTNGVHMSALRGGSLE